LLEERGRASGLSKFSGAGARAIRETLLEFAECEHGSVHPRLPQSLRFVREGFSVNELYTVLLVWVPCGHVFYLLDLLLPLSDLASSWMQMRHVLIYTFLWNIVMHVSQHFIY
jgi:hypothetical protein